MELLPYCRHIFMFIDIFYDAFRTLCRKSAENTDNAFIRTIRRCINLVKKQPLCDQLFKMRCYSLLSAHGMYQISNETFQDNNHDIRLFGIQDIEGGVRYFCESRFQYCFGLFIGGKVFIWRAHALVSRKILAQQGVMGIDRCMIIKGIGLKICCTRIQRGPSNSTSSKLQYTNCTIIYTILIYNTCIL